MIAGLAYVLLSGMSVSAIRAFLMAILVLAAWLSDRLGLTLRNVGLAAGAILPPLFFGQCRMRGQQFCALRMAASRTPKSIPWTNTSESRFEPAGARKPDH